MKIAELFSDDTKWCKHTSALDECGDSIDPTSPYARRWCLSGAIAQCYREADYIIEHGIRGKVAHALRAMNIKDGAISQWNDDPSRTFADVRALVERLAI